VAYLTQQMLEEKLQLPKLQVLIYPWMQLWNFMMPSAQEYLRSSLFGSVISIQRVVTWYLGIEHLTGEVKNVLGANNHTALLPDLALKEKIKAYMDVDLIPAEYKEGRDYYQNYEALQAKMYPEELEESSVLVRDASLASLVSKLHDPSISPLFADDSKLVGLPKTYMIVFEWDSLKDEDLLYAERLKKANVEVHVAFYERVFVSVFKN
jgi:acetyl esterase/lipase